MCVPNRRIYYFIISLLDPLTHGTKCKCVQNVHAIELSNKPTYQPMVATFRRFSHRSRLIIIITGPMSMNFRIFSRVRPRANAARLKEKLISVLCFYCIYWNLKKMEFTCEYNETSSIKINLVYCRLCYFLVHIFCFFFVRSFWQKRLLTHIAFELVQRTNASLHVANGHSRMNVLQLIFDANISNASQEWPANG